MKIDAANQPSQARVGKLEKFLPFDERGDKDPFERKGTPVVISAPAPLMRKQESSSRVVLIYLQFQAIDWIPPIY